MSVLQDRLRCATVADLFAGSGAVGLEALSRGAAHVTFVEKDRRALSVLERNIRRLGAGADTTVVRGDALAHVRALSSRRYDLVLADPPYDHGFAEALLRCYQRHQFAREMWVEHRVGDMSQPDLPVKQYSVQQRKYGDTVLTGVKPLAPRSDNLP